MCDAFCTRQERDGAKRERAKSGHPSSPDDTPHPPHGPESAQEQERGTAILRQRRGCVSVAPQESHSERATKLPGCSYQHRRQDRSGTIGRVGLNPLGLRRRTTRGALKSRLGPAPAATRLRQQAWRQDIKGWTRTASTPTPGSHSCG